MSVRLFRGDQRRKMLAIIVIIAVVGVVAFSLAGSGLDIFGSLPLGDDAQCGYEYSMWGIDEDGDRVEIPTEGGLFQAGYEIGGVEVTKVGAGVEWLVSGQGVEWDSLTITGEIIAKRGSVIHRIGGGGTVEWDELIFVQESSKPFNAAIVNGTFSTEYILGTDIAKSLDTQIPVDKLAAVGISSSAPMWIYQFKASITVQVYDIMGNLISETKVLGTFEIKITFEANITVTGRIIR